MRILIILTLITIIACTYCIKQINISGNNPKKENQITISSIKEHFPEAEVVNEDDNIQNGG